MLTEKSKKQPDRNFPGGPVVENLSCKAGHASLIPGRGNKIPHAVRQLSLRTITRERPKHHNEVKSPHAAMKDPACRN